MSHAQAARANTQETSQKEAITAELERLAWASILAFNDHDFDFTGNADRREFRNRIAPKFQARIENNSEEALSFEELTKLWRGFEAAEPECRFEITNTTTDINVNGTAVMYLEMDIIGIQGVMLVRFMEMKWKIIKGKWMYYSCTTMRGNRADGGARHF